MYGDFATGGSPVVPSAIVSIVRAIGKCGYKGEGSRAGSHPSENPKLLLSFGSQQFFGGIP